MELVQKETSAGVEYSGLIKALQDSYEKFIDEHGPLNLPVNRKLIANDTAFGFTILSSLERKEGERYVQADIITQSLHPKGGQVLTNDPIEGLAQCLNQNGKVEINFIKSATGLSEFEILNQLGSHIYINPQHKEWETVDQYLSGNVVEKLKAAREQTASHPDNVQFQRSLEAIEKYSRKRYLLNCLTLI